MSITEGIHFNIPESVYHADPCPAPSLSASVARELLRSPMHGHYAHPRLNPDRENTSSKASEEGTIIHKLVLGRGSEFEVIDADDWRTKAAKEARDAARDAGRVPVLAHRMDALEEAADAIKEAIVSIPDLADMDEHGHAEVTLIWREPKYENIWCRARVDWLPTNPRAPLYDLKTTGLSADPRDWQRRMRDVYRFQAAWYLRAAHALGLHPPAMIFAVAETAPPYGISTMAAAPSLLALADAECERALATWAQCLRTDQWPGYPTHTAYVDAAPWQLAEAEDQAMRDEFMEAAQ